MAKTQYSSRGSLPSVSIMPRVASNLDVPSRTPSATPTTATPPTAQPEASDKSYTGQAAVTHFSQLKPDHTTLSGTLTYRNGKLVFEGTFYPIDSSSSGVTPHRAFIAQQYGLPSTETRLTEGRLAKMIMPCVRVGKLNDYNMITAQVHGPVAHCLLKSMSPTATSSSVLRVETDRDGFTKITISRLELATQSVIAGEGKCNFGIGVLHQLKESYPDIYPILKTCEDQEDLEAALEGDDIEAILEREEEIVQSFGGYDKMPPVHPRTDPIQQMLERRTKALGQDSNANAAIQRLLSKFGTTTSPKLPETSIEEQKEISTDDAQDRVPPRDAEPASSTEQEPEAQQERSQPEEPPAKAPVCDPPAPTKKKRGASEACLEDEGSYKRSKGDEQKAQSDAVKPKDSALDDLDSELRAAMGLEDFADSTDAKEPPNKKKRQRSQTGSDDTEAPAGSKKKSKTDNDDANTKDVHDYALFALPPAPAGEKQTGALASKPEERKKKETKPKQRPVAPVKPSPSISASTSPSGAGSTASNASTGRTTPQSASEAFPPPKSTFRLNLSGNKSGQHAVRDTKSDSGKPRPEKKPKDAGKKASQPELEPSGLLVVEEEDETPQQPLQKVDFKQSKSQKKGQSGTKRPRPDDSENDAEAGPAASQPPKAKKPKQADGQTKPRKPAGSKFTVTKPSPKDLKEDRPADCITDRQVRDAYASKVTKIGKSWDVFTKEQLRTYLAYYGITFTAQRVDKPPLVEHVESICKPIYDAQQQMQEERLRRQRELREADRQNTPAYQMAKSLTRHVDTSRRYSGYQSRR